MTSAIERLTRWWFQPAPAQRLATIRVLVGAFAVVYLLARAPNLIAVSGFGVEQFAPVGPVVLLGQPLSAALALGLAVLTLLAGIAFMLGWRYRVAGPLFAVLLLWVLSYRNSWGMVFHTENLLVVHVLALAFAPAADTYALDGRRREVPEAHGRYGWAIKLMCTVVVIAYVISALAKLRNSGWDWVTSDILRNYIAYDNLRKVELGDTHSPFGAWLVAHGWVFPPIAFATIAVELAAPLALLGRRAATIWVIAVWGFHVGVLAVMAILFPYQLLGIGFAPFFRVERLAHRLLRRMRPDRPAAAVPA